MSKQTMLDIFGDGTTDVEELNAEFDLSLDTENLEMVEKTLNMEENVTGDLEEVSIDEQFETVNLSSDEIQQPEPNISYNVENTQTEISTNSIDVAQSIEAEEISADIDFGSENGAFDVNAGEQTQINTADLEKIANQNFEETSDIMLEGNFNTLDTTKFEQEVGGVTLVEDPTMGEIAVKIEPEEMVVEKVSDFGKLKIAVIGVGGCGCNAINRMYREITDDIKLISIDTDERRLEENSANEKILIGEQLLHGNGSGGDELKVKESFIHAEGRIREQLAGVHMVFITGSLSGGTGKIGLVEVGRLAKGLGILTLAFAIAPDRYEADIDDVNHYYKLVSETVDSTILIESDKASLFAFDATPEEVQDASDELLINGIRGIYELATKPGKVNLDFADIRTTFKEQGTAIMSIGFGEGENNIVDAVYDAINSEFLDSQALSTAKYIIFALSFASQSVTVDGANRATGVIHKYVSEENIEHLFLGMSLDESLGDRVKVTVVACGMDYQDISFDELEEPDGLDFGEIFGKVEAITDKNETKTSKKQDIFEETEISGFDSDVVISTEEKNGDDYPDFF